MTNTKNTDWIIYDWDKEQEKNCKCCGGKETIKERDRRWAREAEEMGAFNLYGEIGGQSSYS